jgi:hypothetical protein
VHPYAAAFAVKLPVTAAISSKEDTRALCSLALLTACTVFQHSRKGIGSIQNVERTSPCIYHTILVDESEEDCIVCKHYSNKHTMFDAFILYGVDEHSFF